MRDTSNDALNKGLEKRGVAEEDEKAAEQQGYMSLNAIGMQELGTKFPDTNAVDATNAEASAAKAPHQGSGPGPSAETVTDQQSGAFPTEEVTGHTKADGLSAETGTATVPEPDHSQQEDKKKVRSYGPEDLVKLFIPISLCMLIVVLCVRHLETFKRIRTIHQRYMPNILMEEDTSAVAATASYIVAYFMMLFVVVTFAVVLLFYLKCYIVILIFIVMATLNVLIFLSSAIYYHILRELDLPVSVVLFLFALYNIVVVQMMSIFWKGPKRVQQASLVIFSAVVALTILEMLPYWITWLLLAVLSVWDLIAVLTPCGPLRLLINLAQKRNHDIMPALLYTGSLTFSYDESSETRLLAAGKTGYTCILFVANKAACVTSIPY